MSHSALWDYSGQLFTWGSSEYGKLGHANTYGVLRKDKIERHPRKVILLDTIFVIGAALGDDYTLTLESCGKIKMIGRMNPIRNRVEHDLDYINPITISMNEHKFIKIRSGRKHALAVDIEGDLYTFGEDYDGSLGQPNHVLLDKPMKVPGIDEDHKVVDFDCADYFSLVIIHDDLAEVNPVIYEEFKRGTNQKIVQKIFSKQQRYDQQHLPKESIPNLKDMHLKTQERRDSLNKAKLSTHGIRSFILKPNFDLFYTRFAQANSPLLRIDFTSEEFQALTSDFHKIFDFLKLPLHIAKTKQELQIPMLQKEIKRVFMHFSETSEYFKNYLDEFHRIQSKLGIGQTFNEFIFEMIVNEPIVKKIMGPYMQSRIGHQRVKSNTLTRSFSSYGEFRSHIHGDNFQSSQNSSILSNYITQQKHSNSSKLLDPIKEILSTAYGGSMNVGSSPKNTAVSSFASSFVVIHPDQKRKEISDKKNLTTKNRILVLNEKSKHNALIRSQQRIISHNIYKKRKERLREAKRKELCTKISQKDLRMQPDFIIKKKKAQKLHDIQKQQKFWITIFCFFLSQLRLKVINECGIQLIYANYQHVFHVNNLIIRMQRYWKYKLTLKKIKTMPQKHKDIIGRLSIKMKEKCIERIRQTKIEHAINYCLLNKIRRKARVKVSIFKNKVTK